jgi:hypothetical protein
MYLYLSFDRDLWDTDISERQLRFMYSVGEESEGE